MKIQTKDITMAGLLVALTGILGTTGIGFLPVPTPAGAATLMHIPVVLAGLVSTPLVASFVGLIFGLFCFKFMGDLRVVIPARLLVGVVSWLVYRLCGRKRWAIPVAAVAGSLTNTVGTLWLAVIFGYIPASGSGGAITLGVVQGIPEALLAAVLLIPITIGVEKLFKISRTSKDGKSK